MIIKTLQKIKDRQIEKQKDKLLDMLWENDKIAVVGRVKDWLLSSESRYPISCTMLSVEDSMEGASGIEYSWTYASKALRFGAGCAIDLSKLRPKDTDNGRGLVSSGAASFAQIYSILNEILRRGGVFKNGAIVAYLDSMHPDLDEFLSSDLGEWIKKAVYVSDDPGSPDYLLNHPDICDKLLYYVKQGTVWLAKKRWYHPQLKRVQKRPPTVYAPRRIRTETSYTFPIDPYKYRVYSQVCLEILLPSRGTCILSHVNLGRCTPSDIPFAFEQAMEFLCKLHKISGAGKSNYYLSPKEDKQVGLGVIGLANYLAIQGISYKEFTDCLYDFVTNPYPYNEMDKYQYHVVRTVKMLVEGFDRATKVARKYGMQRAFTIAPTATCSYRYEDREGYTTTPEISPPICHPVTKKIVRDSSTFGMKEYQYNPKVETAQEVGWETYYKLVKAWQSLMDQTGLAHSISFNIWDQCPVDRAWLKDWIESPIVTTYYRMLVGQGYADKSSINIDGITLTDDDDNFFMPVEDTDEYSEPISFTAKDTKEWFARPLDVDSDQEEEIPGFCKINDPNCSSCGE